MAANAQSGNGLDQTGLSKFTIVPTASATMTLTDNVGLSAHDRKADLITELSPGIQITSNAGRIKGSLSYSLNAIAYASESSSNNIQHALNGAATIEAVENWAFVDLTGNISQQLISAFGTQSSNNTSINSNRTTVSTYSISPYVRGPIGSFATYDARLTYTGSGSGSAVAANGSSTTATARVGGAGGTRIGWSVDASRQTFEQSAEGTVHSDRVNGVLSYAVSPELRVSVNGGHESQNIESQESIGGATKGWGFDWTPNERTSLSVSRTRRFFGDSHTYSFAYRTPRTVWNYTDNRDLTSGFGQLQLTRLGTTYDLLFAQFASIEPDPVARAVLVTTFLQQNNISPNTVVLGGSLASASLVQRVQSLSFAWLGLRDTLTVALSKSDGQRADRVVVVSDDFANGNQVRQRGLSVGWAHRLTPSSTLNANLSVQNSSGSVNGLSSRFTTGLLTWAERLGGHTSVTLSARHSRGDSSGDEGYNESALIATLSKQF
jgi:uncharacterized protein (PEP-CTERM system associated)